MITSRTRRGRRDIAEQRCPYGKTPYRTFEAAQRALHRLNGDAEGGSVYRCRACGYRHVTRSTRAEYDRRQACPAA